MSEDINSKYFIDSSKYNCPFCKTKSVQYTVSNFGKFKSPTQSFYITVICNHCSESSMHFLKEYDSLHNIFNYIYSNYITKGTSLENSPDLWTDLWRKNFIKYTEDIDKLFFMHLPNLTMVMNEHIPKNYKDLFNEALTCINANCKTGASACVRKTIYELVKDIDGEHYSDKIKKLKVEHPSIDDTYITMLDKIQGITSDQIHEKSYDDLSNQDINLYLGILNEIFNEIFVIPKEKELKKAKILGTANKVTEAKK